MTHSFSLFLLVCTGASVFMALFCIDIYSKYSLLFLSHVNNNEFFIIVYFVKGSNFKIKTFKWQICQWSESTPKQNFFVSSWHPSLSTRFFSYKYRAMHRLINKSFVRVINNKRNEVTLIYDLWNQRVQHRVSDFGWWMTWL